MYCMNINLYHRTNCHYIRVVSIFWQSMVLKLSNQFDQYVWVDFVPVLRCKCYFDWQSKHIYRGVTPECLDGCYITHVRSPAYLPFLKGAANWPAAWFLCIHFSYMTQMTESNINTIQLINKFQISWRVLIAIWYIRVFCSNTNHNLTLQFDIVSTGIAHWDTSQKFRASYGMSFVGILEKIDRIITAPHFNAV